MNLVKLIDGVYYYTGDLKLPDIAKEPESTAETQQKLEQSSNWMKFFANLSDYSDEDLKKFLTVELRGRRREQMLDRIRAAYHNRNLLRDKEQIEAAAEEAEKAVAAFVTDKITGKPK